MSSALKPKPRARKASFARGMTRARDGFFQTAFHGSPAIHSIVRLADNVIVEVNEAFGRMLGYQTSIGPLSSMQLVPFLVYFRNLMQWRSNPTRAGWERRPGSTSH